LHGICQTRSNIDFVAPRSQAVRSGLIASRGGFARPPAANYPQLDIQPERK
jgi:hypothetical protein